MMLYNSTTTYGASDQLSDVSSISYHYITDFIFFKIPRHRSLVKSGIEC